MNGSDFQSFLTGYAQTSALYHAQYVTFYDKARSIEDFRPVPDFYSRAEIAKFGDVVLSSEFTRNKWPQFGHKPISFEWNPPDFPPNSDAATDPINRRIGVLPIAATKATLLHELAHMIDADVSGVRSLENYESHGPKFAGILLQLLEQFDSPESAKKLQENFDKFGVKYILT